MTLAVQVCITCVLLKQGAHTAGAGSKAGHLNYSIT